MSLPIDSHIYCDRNCVCEDMTMSSKLAHTHIHDTSNPEKHLCEFTCSPDLRVRTESTASPSHICGNDSLSVSPYSSKSPYFWSPSVNGNSTKCAHVCQSNQTPSFVSTPIPLFPLTDVLEKSLCDSNSTNAYSSDKNASVDAYNNACSGIDSCLGNNLNDTQNKLMITPVNKKCNNTLTPATVCTNAHSHTQTYPHNVGYKNRGSLAHARFCLNDERVSFHPHPDSDTYTSNDIEKNTPSPGQPFRVKLIDDSYADLLVLSHHQRSTTSDGFQDEDISGLLNENTDETPTNNLSKKSPFTVTRMKTTHFSRSVSSGTLTTRIRCRSAPADTHAHAHTDADNTLRNARLALNFCFKNTHDIHTNTEPIHTIPDPDMIRISYINDDNINNIETNDACHIASQASFDMSPYGMRMDEPATRHALSLPIMSHQENSPELRARSASVSGPSLLLGLPSRNYEYDYTPYGYKHVNIVSCAPASSTHLVRAILTDELLIAKAIDLTIFKAQEREQVINEAVILGNMKHSSIVAYKDSFIKDETTLVIIMEYCEGGDLFNYLHEAKKSGEKLSEEQILSWLGQICLGVHYIHSKNILHCDLKTTNIFLTKNGDIKIGDFGIARELRANKTCLSPQRCPNGTLMYMSPEMCVRSSITDKSDQWAVGCMLYEMCTLKHAFQVQSVAQLKKTHRDLRLEDSIENDNFNYSDLLKGLILNMLQTEPENRPSVKQVLEQIETEIDFDISHLNSDLPKLKTKPTNEFIRTCTIPLDVLFAKDDKEPLPHKEGIADVHTHTHRHTQKWTHKRAVINSDANTCTYIPSPCLSTHSTAADSTHMSDAETLSPPRLPTHTPSHDNMDSSNLCNQHTMC